MSRRVLIGLHVSEATQDPAGTLRRLFQTTPQPFEVRILIDPAPNQTGPLSQGIPTRPEVQIRVIEAPGGTPASFNRLLAEPADRYVFVESGIHPGKDWLTHLLTALDADPANGLAGPSTNRCWNEQGVATGARATEPDVKRQAIALARRHAGTWRSMAPLHSLSDFCLAVRADVVATVGLADTAYGRGPCWELDYNVRAARAGFRGVWVPASYVHRGPMPAWRAAAEPELLDLNKRLYQDRFCGRRHQPGGQDLPYHAHCAGDACAFFAHKTTTKIYVPPPDRPPAQIATQAEPLVSCIMPTRGRPRFVAQSIDYFRRQDYPHRELIIVHETDSDIPGGITDPNIRLVRATDSSIGGKRNDAVIAARGEIIAQWDDDDWYSDHRLTRQLRPILANEADITGLNDTLFMVPDSGEFWAVTPDLFSRLFMENVVGGTLVYRRELWHQGARYPTTSLREDAHFLTASIRAGARLHRLSGRDLFIYVRHDRNTWKFGEGNYLQRAGWSRVPEPACLALDRAFYFGPAVTPTLPPARIDTTFVSCVMPTANRRRFVPSAILQFLAQTHPEKELVILDDGDDSVADLVPSHPCIRYLRTPRHRDLGAKRNAVCEAARSDIILHWDDDDWYAPDRIQLQIEALHASGADLCGLDSAFLVDPRLRAAWEYIHPPGAAPWIFGATMCYRREYWHANPFLNVNIGEDARFVFHARPGQLHVIPNSHFFVSLIHASNTSPKHTRDSRWRHRDFAAICALTGPHWPPPATEMIKTGIRPMMPYFEADRY